MYLYYVIYRSEGKVWRNIFEDYDYAVALVETIIEMKDELIKFVRVIKYD